MSSPRGAHHLGQMGRIKDLLDARGCLPLSVLDSAHHSTECECLTICSLYAALVHLTLTIDVSLPLGTGEHIRSPVTLPRYPRYLFGRGLSALLSQHVLAESTTSKGLRPRPRPRPSSHALRASSGSVESTTTCRNVAAVIHLVLTATQLGHACNTQHSLGPSRPAV